MAQNRHKTFNEIQDSVKWAKAHYLVNRDSAFTNPFEGLKKLMGGNKRFVEGKSIRPRQDNAVRKELQKEQKPFSILISCADSRVPNEIVFDQGLGDLFIIRTAGQVMADASFASIEYAAIYLKCKLVVVLGHTQCGAVAAAVKKSNAPAPGHIMSLINDIKPAVAEAMKHPGDTLANAVRQNVIMQVNKLRNLGPILSNLTLKGNILIVGAVYDLHTGKIDFLDETLEGLPDEKLKELKELKQ